MIRQSESDGLNFETVFSEIEAGFAILSAPRTYGISLFNLQRVNPTPATRKKTMEIFADQFGDRLTYRQDWYEDLKCSALCEWKLRDTLIGNKDHVWTFGTIKAVNYYRNEFTRFETGMGNVDF